MSNEIEFPDADPSYVFDRDCLSFRARLGDKSIECLVTAELFMSRFGARDMTEEAMRQAFAEHKRELQEIARNHIANGWIDDQNRIFLTTRFTNLKVIFSERLAKGSDGRTKVNEANRLLVAIIGPNAEEVIVEWDGENETKSMEGISLRISDPTVPYGVKTFLDLQQTQNPSFLRIVLAGIWGSILRGRSQKLILKSG